MEKEYKNRPGYVLKASLRNPRVRRWQKVQAPEAQSARGRADLDVTYKALRDPEEVRKAAYAYAAMRAGQPLGPEEAAQIAATLGQKANFPHRRWNPDGTQAIDPLLRVVSGGRYLGGRKWDESRQPLPGAPAGGQIGGDFLALMRDLTQPGADVPPILVDAFDVASPSRTAAWGEAVARWLGDNGAEVLGFLPRVSSFPDLSKQYVGYSYGLVAPEVVVVARPKGKNWQDLVARYYAGIRKDPLRDLLAEEYAAIEELSRKLEGMPKEKAKEGEDEAKPLREALRRLRLRVAAVVGNHHRRRYQKGEAIAPVGWVDPDLRVTQPVEGWDQARLLLVPAGMSWLVSEAGQNTPPRHLWVAPSLGQYLNPEVLDITALTGERYYARPHSVYNEPMRATRLGNKRGWDLYDMGGYVRAWDLWDRWGPVRYKDETLEEAAQRAIKEKRWVRDVTGQWWLVEHGYVEAHPIVAEKLIYEGVPGMVHVILYNGESWGYLPYIPKRGFEPDDVMLLEGEDYRAWRVPIPDDLLPKGKEIENVKALYRLLKERQG